MVIELVIYLIMLFCTIKTISECDEIDQAICFIEKNTNSATSNNSCRLAKNLRWFKQRVVKKTTELTNKAKFVFNWKDPEDRFRDSVPRLLQDAKNFIFENELFLLIEKYAEYLTNELIANNVLFDTSNMRFSLNDDLQDKKSVVYNVVKSIATLMAYSNAIWFLTYQGLHILSNLNKSGVGNVAVKRSLDRILEDKDCIYKNFRSLLYGTKSYCIDTDVIHVVSNHTYDLIGLLKLVEDKAKWVLVKEIDATASDKEIKEESIMITSNSNEPMQNTKEMTEQSTKFAQEDSGATEEMDEKNVTMVDFTESKKTFSEEELQDFEQVSKYITPKMISQMILMAVEMGKLNHSNFVDFVYDMRKWGMAFNPLFDTIEFGDNFTKYSRDLIVKESKPYVGDEEIPLVNMTGFVKLNPEVYFAECILKTAITIEEDHNPNKVSFGIPHDDGRRIY